MRQRMSLPGNGKITAYLSLMLLVLCAFASPEEENEEYNIKAAFIYRFTNYIDWGSIPDGEFVIGVMGNSPIYPQLAELARTKTVKDRKIIVRQFSKPEEIGPCQILFISKKVSAPMDEILAKIAGKKTLTVTEKSGYAKKGAGINFIEVDDKLKFEANPKNISASGLRASSQLLKLAIIID